MQPSTIYCDTCGTANRPQARFCIGCGQAMPIVSTPAPSAQAGPAVSPPPVSPPSPAGRIGQQLGNYRLHSLLGEGGFAQVYLGEHVYLKTQAAIKLLHMKLAAPDDLDSFLKEAQTVARLIHPHIVRVLEFGLDGQTPFLVMDYAPNGTLRQRHPRGTLLPLPTVVSYVKQVTEALQYAHDKKFIHRDIKPENMLIGEHDAVLLSDFGIALIAQSSRYQSTQDVVGTVSYMSPEQIQGRPRPASDQYSLGIVVYEWLSGDRPFHGSFIELCTQHTMAPPPPLRQKVSTISPEVEQVVLTALAKDPHQRFASVQAFATALEQASKPSVKREPSSQFSSSTNVVTQLSESLQPTNPVIFVSQSFIPTEVVPPRPVQTSASLGTVLCTYCGHSGEVSAVAWSPSSTHIASAGGDKTVLVWDAATDKDLLTYRGHSGSVWSVDWSPDGTHIASASDDKTVQVWDAVTGKSLYTYRGHSLPWSVAWAPDGTRIASASLDKTVQVWISTTGKNLYIYRGHSDCVWSVDWSPDGTCIASASADKTVQVWLVATGKNLFTYRGHSGAVRSVAWAPDGTRIASASFDKTVQVWDAATGKNLLTYGGHSDIARAVAWSSDNRHVASASEDKKVQVWDAATGKNLLTYRGHSALVYSVVWSPDGTRIASASGDKTVQVWQAT